MSCFVGYHLLLFCAQVINRIGAGNFGDVYRGRLWGSDVAVKLLTTATVTDDVLRSLKQEVSILSQLRHPNVVLYMGASTRPPNIFIVTEWCERGCLSDLLYKAEEPLSVATRVRFALQVCPRGARRMGECISVWAAAGGAARRRRRRTHGCPRTRAQAAQGMCYLHSPRRAIIHRDLKSQVRAPVARAGVLDFIRLGLI